MLTLIILLVVTSYMLFVFISESLNPFSAGSMRSKKPHRLLGRATGIASLASGIIAIGLLNLGIGERSALTLYLLLTVLFLIPSLLRFKRKRIWL